jgi:two-component system chemotaxis sensor kinase CheA
MDNFRKKFIEEAQDLTGELENALLRLDPANYDLPLIEHIFRIMHTLKGNSAMFGFNLIDQYTHQLETIYDLIRNGKKKLTADLMDLTLASVDHIRNLLDEEVSQKPAVQEMHEKLLNKIKEIVSGNISVSSEKPTTEKIVDGMEVKTYYVRFQPKADILSDGTNPLFLVEDFKGLGEYLAFPDLSRLPALKDIEPGKCYVDWEIVIATSENQEKIQEIFIFAEDNCSIEIEKLSDSNLLADKNFCQKLAESSSEGKRIGISKIKELLSADSAPAPVKKSESPEAKNINDVTSKLKSISSIRVSSEKLDELINLVSELVTTQAGLSLVAEKINNKELHVLAEDVEKLTRRLRDSTFEIRLIPIENMITRFHRLVRELSHDLKKEITFVTEGTDIELDKNMIEGLIDPIMHIIRNSCDHAIESSADRTKAGKPTQGTIHFKAYHSGSSVYIQISDDGRGIDPEMVRKKAVEIGLINPDSNLSRKEILDLLFVPGFSTSKNITNISGRGVGMDVVKRNIADLRGEVSIETEIGKGTSVILKLPLTLSIIDGLLVSIDNSYFVIPLSSINKCYEFKHENLVNAVNNLIFVYDTHVPFIYLRSEFNVMTEPPRLEQVVVIEHGEGKIGLAVDKVIGEYQAVLKSLGSMYRKQDIISGATILGDGTVALVIDPNKIITQFNYNNQKIAG